MAQVRSAGSGLGAAARVFGAAVVGIAMLLVPTILWAVDKPKAHFTVYAILGLGMLVLCPLVFQLLSGRSRRLHFGAIFALVVAIGLALFFVFGPVTSPVAGASGAFMGIVFFLVYLVPGLIGAYIASLIDEGFDHRATHKGGSRLWPWVIGACLAVIELAASALLILYWV